MNQAEQANRVENAPLDSEELRKMNRILARGKLPLGRANLSA